MYISGISASQRDSLRREAVDMITRHDRNYDGRLQRFEGQDERLVGSDSYSYTTRISDTYVNRTTIYQNTYDAFKAEAFDRADRNRDGELTADEIVDSYLEEKDSNHNGDLGFWEKMGVGAGDLRDRMTRKWTRETDRRTTLEYSPDYDWNRPTPPRPDWDRPTPPRPDWDRPTPPRPDWDRPTPPRPDSSRPTPPRPDSDRPTPPRPDSRPTPPSSGDRPRPPRP